MPTYAYRCQGCDKYFEVRGSIADVPLSTCRDCGGALKRQLYAVFGMVLGGSVIEYGKFDDGD